MLKTILILFSFIVLEFLVTGMAGSMSPLLIAFYALSTIKRKDKQELKTILWFQIALVPAVIAISYLVRMFL